MVSIVRYGFHMEPTTLVLTFSAAMDATPAQNVSNYQLVNSRRHDDPDQLRRVRRLDGHCDAFPVGAPESSSGVHAHGDRHTSQRVDELDGRLP